MVLAPVFRGTPPLPLFIRRGDVLVPAFAENPCDPECCDEPPTEANCDCFDPENCPTLSVTLTIEGLTNGDGGAESSCACGDGYQFTEHTITWENMNGTYLLECDVEVSSWTGACGDSHAFGWWGGDFDDPCNTAPGGILLQTIAWADCNLEEPTEQQEFYLQAIQVCITCEYDEETEQWMMHIAGIVFAFMLRNRSWTGSGWTDWDCGSVTYDYQDCGGGEIGGGTAACQSGSMTMTANWAIPTIVETIPGCFVTTYPCSTPGTLTVNLNV